MSNAEKIIELVKQICQYHPAAEAGRKRGWSHYTGGMADTGGWNVLKMLDADVNQLEQCLLELIEEFKPKPPKVYTDEELQMINTPTIHHLQCGGVIHSNQYEDEKLKEDFEKIERTLLWGK